MVGIKYPENVEKFIRC